MTEEQIILERKQAKEAMDRFFRQQGDFRTEKECRHDWKKNNFLTQAEAEKKLPKF